jgi:hypothetical protein
MDLNLVTSSMEASIEVLNCMRGSATPLRKLFRNLQISKRFTTTQKENEAFFSNVYLRFFFLSIIGPKEAKKQHTPPTSQVSARST